MMKCNTGKQKNQLIRKRKWFAFPLSYFGICWQQEILLPLPASSIFTWHHLSLLLERYGLMCSWTDLYEPAGCFASTCCLSGWRDRSYVVLKCVHRRREICKSKEFGISEWWGFFRQWLTRALVMHSLQKQFNCVFKAKYFSAIIISFWYSVFLLFILPILSVIALPFWYFYINHDR